MKTKKWLDYSEAERKRASKLADKNARAKFLEMSTGEQMQWIEFRNNSGRLK